MLTSDVFALLRDGRPRTRAELADATGLARSTVAARVDVLMRLGLVAPHGGATSTGGRPPSLFALNPASRVVVGVDIGATHAVAGLTDLAGELLAHRRVPMDVSAGPEVVLGWVRDVVAELLEAVARPVGHLASIGIGLPGPVEHASGRPMNPPIMPGWHQFDVVSFVRQGFSVPVLVDNDVNIMALGEQQQVHPEVDDLIYVKVATGIGAGIISGGVLQQGARGTAGDLGHVRVSRAVGVWCRCGNEGCLEAVAAGPAQAAALAALGVPATTGQDVVDLAHAGDVSAVQVVRQAGRDLGEVVATMVNLINPSVVVIGGRMAAAGEPLLAGIREVVYSRSLPLATEHLQIVPSQVRELAGVHGAAAKAIAHVLSPASIEAATLAVLT